MLNKNNYFTLENNYISNSKIGDWLKDKEYFRKRHIDGTVKRIETQPLRLGSAIDYWLTSNKRIFDKKYIAVSRRNLKNPPQNYTELPMAEYNLVYDLCSKTEQKNAYRALSGFQRQVILSQDIDNLGNYKGICGILDFLQVDDKNAIIVDLKTTASIDPKSYHYKALSLGYYRQAAMYSLLVLANYPEVINIECKHLAIEKDPDGIFNCQTFDLDSERIEAEKEFILNTIKEIANEKEFAPKNISWEEAIPIGEIAEEIDLF